MRKITFVIAVTLFALNIGAWAQKPGIVLDNEPGWKKIGETVASFKSQDESIAVIGADEFAAIKIKVEDASLHIDRLQVFYESGEMEEIEVKEKIQAGKESKTFRLENPNRDIQKVAFTYNTVPNSEGDKADVELYGLKSGNEGRESEAYRDDAERAGDEMEEAGEDIEREAEQTEESIERNAERAEEEVEEAGETIEREAEQTEETIDNKAERTEDEIDQRAENTESDLERAADDTGDAIAEAASTVAAEIDDPRHETKVGPDGQTLYISDDERCYYVNDEGKRVYVSKHEMKNKPEKNR